MEPETPDALALRRCRKDPDAICLLYDRYLERLIGALVHAGADPELAFDIAQETFAKTLVVGHKVRLAQDKSAWPWLWRVARNLLNDSYRRASVDSAARRRLGIRAVAADNAIDDLIARLDAQAVAPDLGRALGGLPPSEREAVFRRVTGELGHAELAQTLDISEQAARTRVSRGLRALRLRLAGGKQ